MKVADSDLLLAQMQTAEAGRVHPTLDSRQIIGVLGQELPTPTEWLEQEVVVGHVLFMLSTRNFRVGQSQEIEEIKEHPIRIRRVGAMPKKPGASPEYVEGYIRKDAVMEIINKLRIIQLRKVDPHGRALYFANRPGNGGPHFQGRAREIPSINSRRGQEAIPDGLGHISMLRMTGARHSQG